MNRDENKRVAGIARVSRFDTPRLTHASGRARHDRHAPHRAGPERPAVRRHAVPDGRRPHAGLRRHGPDQPRPRLALHGRRLRLRRGRRRDRLVPARPRRRPRRRRRRRRDRRGRRPPPPLRPRPPRPGARDLRADPGLLRGHPLALRLLPALPRRARRPRRHRPLPGGITLPAYRLADHRRRHRRRRRPLPPDQPHPPRRPQSAPARPTAR